MAKLSLAVDPTFKAKVMIPVPGAEPAPVVFTFRHKTRTQMAEFLSRNKGDAQTGTETAEDLVKVVDRAIQRDADMLMDFVAGWDLEDACTRESMVRLVDQYEQAAASIVRAYAEENAGQKQKN